MAERPDAVGAVTHLVRALAGQVGYAHRELWRSPVLAFVTLGFPLVLLFMLGVAYDDAAADPGSGPPVIHTVVSIAAVFGATMAAYVMLPSGVSRARERGVLKRLRGTPLPLPAYLAGRVVAAVVVAAAGTALMLTNGVTAFDLALSWGQVPALVVTFLVGVVCFAALGVAVAMVLPSSNAVLTFTLGSFMLVAFGSGTFAPDLALPRPLDLASWVFPLRHFAVAFETAIDPAPSGHGVMWSHLAALAGWGVVGAAVARRSWSVDPARERRRWRLAPAHRAAAEATPASPDRPVPRMLSLSLRQARYANRQVWRDPASAFFAVAFPVAFVVVVPYAFGRPTIDGTPLSVLVTQAMAVLAVVVTAYVNLPEAVADQRARGVLTRLRGTPLPTSAYVVGRIASVVWIASLGVVAVHLTAWLVHDVTVEPESWPAVAVVLLPAAPAMAGLGLVIVALAPDPETVSAISLGTFLPLAFVSDILAFGVEMPDPLATLGRVFPFAHLADAVDTAAATGEVAWGSVLVVWGWGLAGAAIAVARFATASSDRT
jgi:ABC-type multidrug transport system permease subunit